ncbi:MAG: lysylphosphatidylglycerol synthase transmembrane domain-containing protein [Planctomycetota bacterium]
MQSRAFTTAKTIAKFAIPAVIIGYLLLYYVGPEEWEQLANQPKNFGLLTAALIVAIGALLLSFVRWCMLVRCQGIELTMLEAIRLGAICFLLSFVSAGSVGGDLFKAIFLARRRPGKRVAAVASVLVDRGVGLFALVMLTAIALLFTDTPEAASSESGEAGIGLVQIKWVTFVLFGIGTVALLFLILGGRSVDRLITAGSKLPVVGQLIAHIGPPLRVFHSHAFAFGAAIVMSLGVHGLLALSVYLVARGLYAAPPTMAEHFVIVPIGMLISALPITPAGIGLFEAAIESMYRVIPAKPTLASGTLVALVFEFVKIIMAVIGTVFYWTANEEVTQSLEDAGKVADDHPDEASVTGETSIAAEASGPIVGAGGNET